MLIMRNEERQPILVEDSERAKPPYCIERFPLTSHVFPTDGSLLTFRVNRILTNGIEIQVSYEIGPDSPSIFVGVGADLFDHCPPAILQSLGISSLNEAWGEARLRVTCCTEADSASNWAKLDIGGICVWLKAGESFSLDLSWSGKPRYDELTVVVGDKQVMIDPDGVVCGHLGLVEVASCTAMGATLLVDGVLFPVRGGAGFELLAPSGIGEEQDAPDAEPPPLPICVLPILNGTGVGVYIGDSPSTCPQFRARPGEELLPDLRKKMDVVKTIDDPVSPEPGFNATGDNPLAMSA